MQIDKTLLAGVAGLLTGFVLSYAAGAGVRSELEARVRQQDEMQATVAALEDRLAELDGRVEAGLSSLGEGVEALGEAASDDGGLAELTARIEGLGGDLSQRLQKVGPDVRATLSQDFEEMRERLSSLAERGAAAAAGAAAAVGGGQAGSASEPAVTPPGEEIGVGEVVTLGDGAVRVFLSAADPAAGTAQVAVNGFTRTAMTVGTPAPAGDCTLVMTGVREGTASFNATCGETPADAAETEATNN